MEWLDWLRSEYRIEKIAVAIIALITAAQMLRDWWRDRRRKRVREAERNKGPSR